MTSVSVCQGEQVKGKPEATLGMIDLRPSLTAYMTQRLAAFQDGFRHNVALLGPVGSGKSQLLQHLLERADPRFVKIYCVLQRDPMREFLRRFSASVLRGALDARLDAPFEMLLQQAGSRLPNTSEAIRQLERYSGGHVQADAFIHALDLIAMVHRDLNRPCILALDEFLHIEDVGLSHAFHEFGKRVMTWPFTLFLVSSSSTFRARDILRERLHLLFGQFELMSPGAVEAPTAMVWMQQELVQDPEMISTMQFLLQWVSSSPWYLSVLLRRMKELQMIEDAQHLNLTVELAADGPRPQRSASSMVLFRAAWDVLGHPHGVLYQRCAANVDQVVRQRYGPIAREALLHIARGARTTQAIARQCGTRRSLSGALQALVEHDLIERRGTCWVIPDHLFACWLSAVLASQQGGGVINEVEAFRAFERVLQATWTRWLDLSAQPLAERISRLFLQFRNETVSLDQKTGRLPSFHRLRTHGPAARQEIYIVADGDERRWCCVISERKLEEQGIAAFEQFCRVQSPRPTRKIVVSAAGLDLNAKLLAKESNMWVWEPDDLNLLIQLYSPTNFGF